MPVFPKRPASVLFTVIRLVLEFTDPVSHHQTQIIWLGIRQQLNKVTARALTHPNATVEFSTTVKDLGVVLDSQLIMADHIGHTQPILLLLHPAA